MSEKEKINLGLLAAISIGLFLWVRKNNKNIVDVPFEDVTNKALTASMAPGSSRSADGGNATLAYMESTNSTSDSFVESGMKNNIVSSKFPDKVVTSSYPKCGINGINSLGKRSFNQVVLL